MSRAVQLVEQHARERAQAVALRHERRGLWQELSWAELELKLAAAPRGGAGSAAADGSRWGLERLLAELLADDADAPGSGFELDADAVRQAGVRAGSTGLLLPHADAVTARATIACWLAGGAILDVPDGRARSEAPLTLVEPDWLVADAVFWDALQAETVRRVQEATPLRRRAVSAALAGHLPLVTRPLVLRPLRTRIGLRRLRAALVPDRPPSPPAVAFLSSLGVPVQTLVPGSGTL